MELRDRLPPRGGVVAGGVQLVPRTVLDRLCDGGFDCDHFLARAVFGVGGLGCGWFMIHANIFVDLSGF